LNDWPKATISFVELSESLDTLSYVYASIHTLTPVNSPTLFGDFNHNGTVDAADYVMWRDGLATTYTLADYDLWRANFGDTASGATLPDPSSAPVPEPATLTMLVLGIHAFRNRSILTSQFGDWLQGLLNRR
jgi:hypothetical protein